MRICEECGEIFEDYIFRVEGKCICEECFREYLSNLSLKEIAGMMDIPCQYNG